MFSSWPPLCNSLQMWRRSFPHHGGKGKKALLGPTPASAEVHSEPCLVGLRFLWCRDVRCGLAWTHCTHCLPLICQAGSFPVKDGQTGRRPPCMILTALNTLENSSVKPCILTNVLGDRTKILLGRTGTHKSQKLPKNWVSVVYKGSRGPSDCSVLTPIYRRNSPSGREAGENVVISRPDKPPPEVVLIERQPRLWANRKILSGPCTEPTNQPGRGVEAFWSRGDVWGERTWASAGSAPHCRWILSLRSWISPAFVDRREATELRFAPASDWPRKCCECEMLGLPDLGQSSGHHPCHQNFLKDPEWLSLHYVCWHWQHFSHWLIRWLGSIQQFQLRTYSLRLQ